jgi:hypothetical protein
MSVRRWGMMGTVSLFPTVAFAMLDMFRLGLSDSCLCSGAFSQGCRGRRGFCVVSVIGTCAVSAPWMMSGLSNHA